MGFLFDERYARGFELFGWRHVLVLALAVGSIVAMYHLRGHLARPTVGRVFRWSVAALIVTGEVVFQVWMASRQGFRLVEAVPLGLCAMVEWITAVALVLDRRAVIKVILPWAFVGASLSFIVVNMGTSYAFPHFRFVHYFGIHWLFLVGTLFYLFTGLVRYGYRDLLRSTAWLAGVALVVLAVDLVTDQNFMFLVSWPDELAFVNELAPFPANTIVLMLGAFVLFNVFYLIFARLSGQQEVDHPGGEVGGERRDVAATGDGPQLHAGAGAAAGPV
ncbi:TIGR02206 family membrane protein [Luedemannella flava]|uniref:TIGR02206 family membrane protein n=1 Tax=Luedemannella flava TaxID=349316 RepID=A0ABN2MLY8_9ACTN